MSKGMREKLHIALVMSRRARLFLLDEPLSGVDPVARRVVLEEIVRDFAPDALMLIATHLIGDVEAVADRAAFMDAGRIVFEGDADDLRAERGAFLEEIFRGELR